MTRRVSCLFAVSSLILMATFATAQSPSIADKCAANAPVKLTFGPITKEHLLPVTIQNTSDKSITAVILSLEIGDPSGAFAPSSSIVDFALSGAPLLPGTASETDANVAVGTSGMPATVVLTCQAVLFQGKDVWGDGKSVEVAKLRAVRQGITAERTRLLGVYNKQGQAKLIDELNRPVTK